MGRTAVFCRFTGCNLWSGREQHRSTAKCRFCDTDFVGTDGPGGGKFADAQQLAKQIERIGGNACQNKFVVFTGGEPLLQLDADLLHQLHERGFEVAVETNGTVPPPTGIDWLTVSPKGAESLETTVGHELKLVYPQPEANPGRFQHLQFDHFFLQPMDGPDLNENTQAAVRYCLAHPQWRLSLQTHKFLGIP